MRPICQAVKDAGKCKGCINEKCLCRAAGEVADRLAHDSRPKLSNLLGVFTRAGTAGFRYNPRAIRTVPPKGDKGILKEANLTSQKLEIEKIQKATTTDS